MTLEGSLPTLTSARSADPMRGQCNISTIGFNSQDRHPDRASDEHKPEQ